MSRTKKNLSIAGNLKAITTIVLPKLQAVIEPLLSSHPHWTLAFYEATALYGFYMAFKQEEVNEFVEFIRSHPEEFRKEVVESKEFRDGFVTFFQDYLKIRVAQKRKVAREVFISFAKCDDKENFELERFEDSLLKISYRSIKTLSFFKEEIFSFKEKSLRERMRGENLKNSDKSEEWWFKLYWEKESLSGFVQKWLYENFNPNSPKVKERYKVKDNWDEKLQSEVFDKEKEESKVIYSAIDELVQLGILKIRVASSSGFGVSGGAEYEFSDFGYKFIEYIKA